MRTLAAAAAPWPGRCQGREGPGEGPASAAGATGRPSSGTPSWPAPVASRTTPHVAQCQGMLAVAQVREESPRRRGSASSEARPYLLLGKGPSDRAKTWLLGWLGQGDWRAPAPIYFARLSINPSSHLLRRGPAPHLVDLGGGSRLMSGANICSTLRLQFAIPGDARPRHLAMTSRPSTEAENCQFNDRASAAGRTHPPT